MLQILPPTFSGRAATTDKAELKMAIMKPIPTEPSITCRFCGSHWYSKVFARIYCPKTNAGAASHFSSLEASSSSLSQDDYIDDNDSRQAREATTATVGPVPCPDEPNLYQIPPDLHPTYRPLPLLVRMVVWTVSSLVVVVCSNKGSRISIRLTPSMIWTPTALFARSASGTFGDEMSNTGARLFFRFITSRYFIGSIFKILLLSLGISTALQERFRPPSRISTRSLMENYFLPSKLSRFETVALLEDGYQELIGGEPPGSNNVGVHWLEYHNPKQQSQVELVKNSREEQNMSTSQRRILHLNHGFGASSLSWLPALPVMVKQLNCRIGLAHDAPGFGFTNRRQWKDDDDNDSEYYTTKRSAKIGKALLLKASTGVSNTVQSTSSSKNDVVLMGHSMGSLTTLRMALDLVKETQKNGNSFNITRCHVILVAPVFRTKTTAKQRPTASPSRGDGGRRRRSWLSALRRRLGRLAVDRPAAYALRRLVSQQSSSSHMKNTGFWRRGLGKVWGDATRLSDADILRFQWPSIGQGWEDGLIQFSKAQFSSSSSSSDGNEDDDARSTLQQLLSAAHPQVTVDVVVGEKDPLVSVKSIDKFFADFVTTNTTSRVTNGVRVRVLPGLGHDPFEEDVEAFVETVKDLLSSSA